jgi:acetyltransferase-like isoleucine patch superfamily enzyme
MKGPVIEPFAKVGANVTVLDHVTIGKNALIGAGAVVIKDIPANSVVVGNPAKIIKNINDIPEYKL